MKKFLLIYFLFQLNWIAAQQITVLDSESNSPMTGATAKFVSGESEFFYLSSDSNGKLNLNDIQFKGKQYLIIQLSFIGFNTLNDTIYKGQDKTFYLAPKQYLQEEVVVTAQYSPTSIDNSINKVKVISQQKINNMAAVNLEDVLTNELNVRLSQDNILGSGMSMQGISGQNVKILIDGVPVIGRLDGQIDLNQINLNDVERIEIIEGPLSVNYGSNALAGTINIITKKPTSKKIAVGINTYTENIGTYNLATQVGFSFVKKHSVSISAGRNYFDGWSSDDDFFPSFAAQPADSSRVKQWNPKEQYFGRLQYNFNYKDLILSYKGELFDETITNFGLPRRTTNSYVAFDDYYHTKRFDNALFAQGKLNNNWSVNWTAAYNDFERVKEARRKDLVTLESSRIPESAFNDVQDTSSFSLFMSRGSVATTRDSSWLNYELGYDINIENASGIRIEGGKQVLSDYAVFASTEISVGNNLLVKSGVRYSYNTKYDAPITPSINAKFAKGKSIFRLSYAKGFRAPSLKELYFNFDDVNHSLFGNENLKAEKSDNYSASVQQKFLLKEVLLKAEISGFYNKIYNQISFAQSNLGGGGDTLEYFNIGENRTKGLNLNFSLLYENLQLNMGGSYIGRYNQLSEENPIDDFSYSMEFVGNATYQLTKPQLTFALFFKHQGELPGFGYDSNGELVKQTVESYQLFDATLSKSFWKKRFDVAIGCKNILDVQNVQASLSGGGAHSGGSSSIALGTGRTLFIKLNLQLSKK